MVLAEDCKQVLQVFGVFVVLLLGVRAVQVSCFLGGQGSFKVFH